MELQNNQLHRRHISLCPCRHLHLPLPLQIPGIALRRVGNLDDNRGPWNARSPLSFPGLRACSRGLGVGETGSSACPTTDDLGPWSPPVEGGTVWIRG